VTDQEPIYCPAQTYRATRDTPAEHCENEVEDFGDLCPVHDEDDRADALYDAWRDSQHDN
jgi:hypothetical protein